MSVRADQRSESSLLFYKIARELRREISCDLLNKFNSKNETFTTEENTVVNQKEQYPAYMVDFIRKDILGLLQKLMQYISIANSIYPACVLEVDKRRLLQDYAIGTAEALQKEIRVRSYSMMIQNGFIRFPKHGCSNIETQLTEFPLGAFDDLCDGLWLALQASQKAGSGKITMSTVKRTARSVANKIIGRVR